MQNGKGDKPRPVKDYKKFLSNWDNIDWSEEVLPLKKKPSDKNKSKSRPK